MGQNGIIALYSTHEPSDPPRVLNEVLRLSGSARVWSLSAWYGADENWAMFQRNLKRLKSGRQIRSLEDIGYEHLATDIPIDEAARHFRPKECLSLDLTGPTIGEGVGLAAQRDIPPEIRGDFFFGDLIIWFGWHDLFECAENEDGHLFARAFLSIRFFGYRTPLDWNEYRRRVFELPEFKEAKARFETVTGPLEQCAFWDV